MSSKDPFQELFDQEIPRSSPPASTRATLDSLIPQFQRARSRRRARVGAVAALAVFGSTGGAAALGAVSPLGVNNGGSPDYSAVAAASAGVAEEYVEAVELDDPVDVGEPVTPTTIPVDPEITDDSDPDDDSDDSPDSSDDKSPEPNDDDSSPEPSDENSSDDPVDDDSSDDDSSDDPDSDGHDHDHESSAPVAGPVTETADDGSSVTIDTDSDGLVLVNVDPADGVRYTVNNDKPDEIDVDFYDIASGDELYSFDFHLIDGLISSEIKPPSS